MIKEYIEAKYDFKVHTAYIVEVNMSVSLEIVIRLFLHICFFAGQYFI